LILPYHLILDALRETTREALGTTKRGVGPAYEDKAARRGIRVIELLRPDRLEKRLAVAVEEANARIARQGGKTVDFQDMLDFCVEHGKRLAPYITDVSHELDLAIKAGKSVLFEGAQGLLLDLDHGTYPFVTSSTTLAGGASPGIGVSPAMLGNVVGVTKAYLTRVGEGPMPSQDDGEAGHHLATVGHEVGATTGRPRRCGWLDLVALRYAVRVSGIRYLALTKLDVLAGMGAIKVCVGYRLNGQELSLPPMDTADWSLVEPIYREVEGFDSLEGVSDFADLPPAAKAYVRMIEQDLAVKVALVSVGPGREASLPLHGVW
jgi:adenylosuccinate synthase